MNTDKWKLLMRVCDLGSVTEAASEFGYTQPGATQILKSLERECGLPLLKRNGGKMEPTENMLHMQPFIRQLLRAEEGLQEMVDGLRGLTRGKLRIGAFTSVSVHWLPPILKIFENDWPQIEITILTGDYHDVNSWLAEGEIDLGFITLPAPKEYRVIPLRDDPLLAVLPLDHKYASLPKLPVTRIENERFISLLESSDQDTRMALTSLGVKPNIRYTSKDDYAILAMVENGLGMTIMPGLLLEGRQDKVKILELVPGAWRRIALAMPREAATPAAESFARYVTSYLGLPEQGLRQSL